MVRYNDRCEICFRAKYSSEVIKIVIKSDGTMQGIEQFKVVRVLIELYKLSMRLPNQLSAVNESQLFLTTMDSEIEVKIQVQLNDFTINFILLLNFKESFFNYLNLGEKLADFSKRSSRRFSLVVGTY